VASIVAFIIITVLHIILGELVPKALALLYPEAVSGWVVAPLMGFAWVMAFPIAVLNGTANRLLRLMRIDPPGEHERLHSPEEIRMLVEQSTEGGSLLKQDARLLEGVFEFSEKTAQEVMTPRTQMIALQADLPVEGAADEVAAAGRSRYPVYTDSLDEIVGVVHAKDVLAALRSNPGRTVREIMRPPLFVPGTREVEDVLADMKRLKTHLAVVLDEYGGTAGLVTMEDLLEEIVGPIYDEYDPQVKARPAGAPQLDGAMPISDFNTEYGEQLDDTDYTTIGGYVFGQLGRLPRPGDRVPAGRHVLEVVEMEGRRVKSLRLHTPQPEAEPESPVAGRESRAS
jgi:CBS domain containing-hemolysin-like protein